jgi:hypothetical protein
MIFKWLYCSFEGDCSPEIIVSHLSETLPVAYYVMQVILSINGSFRLFAEASHYVFFVSSGGTMAYREQVSVGCPVDLVPLKCSA